MDFFAKTLPLPSNVMIEIFPPLIGYAAMKFFLTETTCAPPTAGNRVVQVGANALVNFVTTASVVFPTFADPPRK